MACMHTLVESTKPGESSSEQPLLEHLVEKVADGVSSMQHGGGHGCVLQ